MLHRRTRDRCRAGPCARPVRSKNNDTVVTVATHEHIQVLINKDPLRALQSLQGGCRWSVTVRLVREDQDFAVVMIRNENLFRGVDCYAGGRGEPGMRPPDNAVWRNVAGLR